MQRAKVGSWIKVTPLWPPYAGRRGRVRGEHRDGYLEVDVLGDEQEAAVRCVLPQCCVEVIESNRKEVH